MEDEFTENSKGITPPSAESRASDTENDKAPDTPGESQEVPERLERVEAALRLVLDHLQTVTKGTEILEAEHSRSILSSIALGISAVALLALWSIAILYPDIATDILRFSIGMSLLFLAAVVDLASAPLLRKAVNRAVLEKDPSRLILGQGYWYRFLLFGYWARIKSESPNFFSYQVVRCSAFVIYLVAGAFLIWAMIAL